MSLNRKYPPTIFYWHHIWELKTFSMLCLVVAHRTSNNVSLNNSETRVHCYGQWMATASPEMRAEEVPTLFRFSRSAYPVILRQRNRQRMKKYGWMSWDMDSWGHFRGCSETSCTSGHGCTALSSCSSPE